MFLLHSVLLVLAVGPAEDSPCSRPLTREAVIECAIASSPRLQADRERVAVAKGEANAARVLLPSNPTVAVTVGGRWNTMGDRAINVGGTLSQRVETAGQRRKRKEAAAATAAAHELDAESSRRKVVADALVAYYDVLAAREEVAVIERGHATSKRMRQVADARSTAGVGAPMDGDLTAAEEAALQEQVALARGRVRVAEARLGSALGLDPAGPLPEVRGSLKPLSVPTGLRPATEGAQARPEIAAHQRHRQAALAHLRVLKRERAPSPTLSFFAQTDGFNERVLGGGIAFPIPLPFPLGRTNKGQIEATRARIREADATMSAEHRALTLEAAVAYHEFAARKDAAAAYTSDSEKSAQQSLRELSAEIERGSLPVRDALLTQQALIELLLRAIESRHALCHASVVLALAGGVDFEGGAR